VTGGEAMYCDMGHFGRVPIRLAWFAVALPALVLQLFWTGRVTVADPGALENPFYQLAPTGWHYPLVAFATVATVIASQAIYLRGVFIDASSRSSSASCRACRSNTPPATPSARSMCRW